LRHTNALVAIIKEFQQEEEHLMETKGLKKLGIQQEWNKIQRVKSMRS